MRTDLVLAVWLCGAVLGGCGSAASTREPIHGTVTLQGAPLDQGTITFFPQQAQGPAPAAATAPIVDGQYSLPAEQGLEPGVYHAVLSSLEVGGLTPGPVGPGKRPAPGKERIPPEFGASSTQTVEVQAGALNQFDFTIP